MGLKNNVTIFVRGITKETTEKDVKELFQEYGKIKQITIPIDYQTKQTKEIAFVTFSSNEET